MNEIKFVDREIKKGHLATALKFANKEGLIDKQLEIYEHFWNELNIIPRVSPNDALENLEHWGLIKEAIKYHKRMGYGWNYDEIKRLKFLISGTSCPSNLVYSRPLSELVFENKFFHYPKN